MNKNTATFLVHGRLRDIVNFESSLARIPADKRPFSVRGIEYPSGNEGAVLLCDAKNTTIDLDGLADAIEHQYSTLEVTF